jgi:tRNA threonylcarbamoyladenosine biosynthesis protein TsaE
MLSLSKNKKNWELEASLENLPQVADRLKSSIADSKFCLWLDAEMGSGKTTFTRYFLQSLGLSKNEVVSSPTFTLMFEYQIKNNWYAHIDFYRVPAGFSLEEENILAERDYQGVIIEWPSKCMSPQVQATHILQIIPLSQAKKIFKLYQI